MTTEESLRSNLLAFFAKTENIEKLLGILNRKSPVSLRLLDYFCVTYAKSKRVNWKINEKYFDAYSSYKNQLNNFSKKKFDPFRRNKRIPLSYQGKTYTTTIAQLCFFRWCIQYQVLEYVDQNKNDIMEEMKSIQDLPPQKRSREFVKGGGSVLSGGSRHNGPFCVEYGRERVLVSFP